MFIIVKYIGVFWYVQFKWGVYICANCAKWPVSVGLKEGLL